MSADLPTWQAPERGYWARIESGQPLRRPLLPTAPHDLPELSDPRKGMKQLKAKQHRIVTRQRALDVRRTCKADTLRKTLACAVILAKVDQDLLETSTLREWLNDVLTRAKDQALFDGAHIAG